MLVEGKVAVITGIGPGMGREIALLFARNGARLAIGARSAARLAEVAAELEALGSPVLFQPTDLTRRDSCRALVQAALERFGRVDVLIQNGHDPGDGKLVEDADPEVWRRNLDCNFFGALHLVQACIPSMKKQREGRIILVNSGGAFQPPPGLASYSAGKAAMASLVRSLAIELGPHGIRANGVHLGMVEGENVDGWIRDQAAAQGKTPEQMRQEFATQRYPIQHIPTPEECAGAVLFLASDLSRAVTGQALMVNGGEYFR
jgi:NAD(P)-dependent dehydrogenase (short-subunit alcohol dehydrogenase family)